MADVEAYFDESESGGFFLPIPSMQRIITSSIWLRIRRGIVG
jgi:hypothetical protein